MLKFNADMRGLTAAAKELGAIPSQIERARKSALNSTAWMSMTELRNHVEYGGTGWKKLHPMTIKTRKSKRYNPGATPLFFLGRFARYRVDQKGTLADIDFGKSRKGKPGTFDPELVAMIKRHEHGMQIPVTGKMRGWFPWASLPRARARNPRASAYAGGHARKPRNAVAGKTYFPLKKSTRQITIPRRPIFAPVWRKIQPKLAGHFNEKFVAAIGRYLSGAAKT